MSFWSSCLGDYSTIFPSPFSFTSLFSGLGGNNSSSLSMAPLSFKYFSLQSPFFLRHSNFGFHFFLTAGTFFLHCFFVVVSEHVLQILLFRVITPRARSRAGELLFLVNAIYVISRKIPTHDSIIQLRPNILVRSLEPNSIFPRFPQDRGLFSQQHKDL